MVRRAAELEERMIQLWQDYIRLCPDQYLDEADPRDPLACAWDAAAGELLHATSYRGYLSIELRERAGIKEPGPVQRLFQLERPDYPFSRKLPNSMEAAPIPG